MDTATNGCSVALTDGARIAARRSAPMARGQAEALVPMIAAVMDEAGVDFGALDLLAVTVGPGAFTGLRIGLAAARGMALTTGLKCLGVTTTEAIARGVDGAGLDGRRLLVAIDTKRNDLYAQMFSPAGQVLGQPEAVRPEDLAAFTGNGPLMIAGDAATRAAEILRSAGTQADLAEAPGLPDAAMVAAVAEQRWQAMDSGERTKLAPPTPLYLRPPDAKPAKDGGGLRPSRPSTP
ncbi:MAG: tRNA (adenosine(37)-N6)-threonylcarbamoyltransferase complex dimerization subunit type 1 TsaB [Rhodospirillaceae bacterium]|nr:tRNA (adenosine(37)-N6)-threonylcarbamoyltransferase complex dimerization subunit type 1 TsaB [Rhodospirillaceae bacterium]